MKLENNIENQNLRDTANISPKNERGSTMVEYALLVALIVSLMSILMVGAIGQTRESIAERYEYIHDQMALGGGIPN